MILEFVTSAVRNRIIVGAASAVGLIIGVLAGVSNSSIVYQGRNSSNVPTWNVDGNGYNTNSGGVLVHSGSTVNALKNNGHVVLDGQDLLFPAGAGANTNVLSTNGAGILAWSAAGGGGTTYYAAQGLSLNGANAFSTNASLSGTNLRFTTISGSTLYAKNGISDSGALVIKSASTFENNLIVRGSLSGASLLISGAANVNTQAQGDNTTLIATDAFVQTALNALNPAASTAAATAAILPNAPTYLNGVSGIGASLTAGVTNTTLVVDGYTPALNDRILVKNQASTFQNGVYYVSQVASLGVAWILTRSLDFDQSTDINNTGEIPVLNGTANSLTSWVETATVTTVGTDPITFSEFTYNPTSLFSVAGQGLNGNGTLVSLANTHSGVLIRAGAFIAGSTTLNPKGAFSVSGSGTFTKSMSGNIILVQSGGYVRGRLAIGKTTALSALDVVGTVSGSTLYNAGQTIFINGHTYTFPTTQGTSNQCLANNGSDVLSWITPAGTTYAAAQNMTLANNAFSLSLSFSGSRLTLGNSKVTKGPLTVYGSGTFTKAMSGNTILVQSGGSVLGRLGIGKLSPLSALDVVGTVSGSSLYVASGPTSYFGGRTVMSGATTIRNARVCRNYQQTFCDPSTLCVTGTGGVSPFMVPPLMDRMTLSGAKVFSTTAGTTGLSRVQVKNATQGNYIFAGSGVALGSGRTSSGVYTLSSSPYVLNKDDVLIPWVPTVASTAPKGFTISVTFCP